MSDHCPYNLGVGRIGSNAQALEIWLGTPQHIIRPQARLLEQRSQFLLGERLDKIIDLVVADAVFEKQLRELSARRAGRFFVDCDLWSHILISLYLFSRRPILA